jgi:hypothetical protein
VRPEVADALGGLEQSLVDVATWERLQPSPVPPPPPPPAGSEVPSGRGPDAAPGVAPEGDEEGPADDGDGGADGPQLLTAYTAGMAGIPGDEQPEIPVVPPPPPPAADLPPELQIDLDPRVRPVADGPEDDARLLSRVSGDQVVDELESSGAVLAAARGVQGAQPPTPEQMEAEQRARRGVLLTWVGAVILACAAVAWWLIPDRGDDSDTLPAVDQTTTTADALLLDPDQLTTTSITLSTTTSTTAAPVVTAAPPTTAVKTTTTRATTKTTTKATTPATTPTTAPETTTTLGQPGPPGTSAPRPIPTTSTTTPGTVVTLPQSIGP